MIRLGLLMTLAAVVGSNRLGYEYIYKYRGFVQTTVQKPVVSESNYMIHANIHVQGLNTGNLIFLDNVTYTLYTGKADDSKVVTNVVDAPVEAQNIKLPFFVERGKSINSIFTQTDDELWSINMKKAIASLFELNNDGINWEKKKPYSFYSDEKSVYGTCKVFYNVIPTNGSHSVVRKHLIPSACKDFKWEVFFNIGDLPQCETSFEEPISISSDRTYNIVKDGPELIINNIQSIGSILFHPFNGKGNSHSVLVKQSIILDETRQLNDIQKVDMSQMTQHEIGEFLYSQHQTEDKILDLTLSRRKTDMETLLPQIMKTLKVIKEYSYDIHVTLTSPDVERGQSINTLLTYLRMLNMENLELLFRNIDDEESRKIFFRILPQVGTHPSSVFIMKLVQKKTIESKHMVLHLLRTMPFHIRVPNIELLSDLSEMHELTTDNDDTKEVGMLSFATIISKALKYCPEKESKINIFISYYISGFKNATDDSEQTLFVSALHNIGGTKVAEFLKEIIRNGQKDFPITHGLRVRAMWAAKQAYTNNLGLLNQIYWPILTDITEHLEVRSAALSILMSNFSKEQFPKLFRFMQTEEDGDLYNLYYSTLKSFSQSTSPCLQSSSKQAKEMLEFNRMPTNSTGDTVFRQFDYLDSTYGFGAVFKINRVGGITPNGFTSYFVQMSSQLGNVNVNSYSAYIKIRTSKKIHDPIFSSTKLPNILDLYSALKSISYYARKDIHVELVLLHFNKVIYSKSCSGNDLQRKFYYEDVLSLFFDISRESLYSGEQIIEGEVNIPNDMGIPTLFFMRMPRVHKLKFGLSHPKSNVDILTLKFNLTQWNHQVYGLNTYNPIADLWHGSRHVFSLDARFALAVDLNMMSFQHMQFIFNELLDPYYSNIGFQAHNQAQVFIYNQNENNAITDACPECKPVIIVTKGDNYRKQYVIWEKDLEDTGMNYKLTIFDCERQYSLSGLLDIKKHIFQTNSKNWGDYGLIKYGLMMRHLWDYWRASPVIGSCGIGFLISPSSRYPLSHAQIDFRGSSRQLSNEPTTTTKIEDYFTFMYNLIHNNSIIRTWDFHLSNNYDDGEQNGIDIELSRKAPDTNDYKICSNMTELWLDQLFTREWKIVAGDTIGDICPTNKTNISIHVKGELSAEQKDLTKSSSFPECKEKTRSSAFACSESEAALRHYEYNIKYENLSTGLKEYLTTVSDWLKMIFSDYFVRSYDLEHIGANQMRIELNYPLEDKAVNVSILGDDYHYRYIDVPLRHWYWTGVIQPISTHHSSMSYFKYNSGFTQTCEFNSEYVLNHANVKTLIDLSEESNLYSADCSDDETCKWQIYAKKTGERRPMGLRIVVANDTLDIITGFKFFYNDEKLELSNDNYGSAGVFKFKVVNYNQKVIVYIPKMDVNVDFDGNIVYAHLPRSATLRGYCSVTESVK